MSPPMLLDLPDELLLQLPTHLRNIEDFKNVASSCRRLRTVLADTLPKTILQLAASSAPTFFKPHPSFLVLSVARRLAHWTTAIDSEREVRIARLVHAFRDGVNGILEFALRSDVEGVGITMYDIRRMHLARFSVINPLDQTVDAMIGKAWYGQHNFWNGGAEDAYTLDAEADEATMQLLIYAELFGPTMEQFLLPAKSRSPGLGPDVRIEFVKYCIPDWICPKRRSDGFKTDRVGPYAGETNYLRGYQLALTHMIGGAMFTGVLWKRAWRRVLIEAGAEENEDGRWPEEWIKVLQRIQWRKERRREEEDEEEEEGFVNGEDNSGNNGEEHIPEEHEDDENNSEEEGEEDEEDENEDDDDDDDNDDTNNNEPPQDTSPPFVPPTDYDDGTSIIDPALLPPWRFTLFFNALTTASPLSTFSLIAQFKGREEGRSLTISPEQKAQILSLRDKVLALGEEDKPGFKNYGRRWHRISEAPHLAAETYWCCAGMWMFD